MVRILEVLLNDIAVGVISEEADGRSVFRFEDDYRHLAQRPILGQFFEDNLETPYRSKRGLPAFFANLVPEGALRRIIERSASIPIGDDFALLERVGLDLPGAVVLRAGSSSTRDQDGDSADEESDISAEDEPEGLRFSLAGVQLKFSMSLRGDRLTVPAHGSRGDWIVKLPSSEFPELVENELATMTWARCSGFDVPDCSAKKGASLEGLPAEIIAPDATALSVKRFDRSGSTRIHQEDFAQVCGLRPDLRFEQVTYEQMGQIIAALTNAAGLDEFIRRLTFMIATGNSDAHLKNWSIRYPDGVTAELSPLYDQVSTVAWKQVVRRTALKLAGRKEFGTIDMRAFEVLGQRTGLDAPHVRRIVSATLENLAQSWRQAQQIAPFPKEHIDALMTHWSKVPLLRDTIRSGLGSYLF